MRFSLIKWTAIVPVIKETFFRFPLPVISSVFATLLAVLLVHDLEPLDGANNLRLMMTLIYMALGLTSLKLLVESEAWSVKKHVIAAVAVTFFISLFTWGYIIEDEAAPYFFFTLAVITSLLFMPYIRRASSAASFWYFNYQSGVAIFFAVIATIITGAGLSLILVSIGYLFEIKIPHKVMMDVWVISWGMLFSIYFLANISREFDFKEEKCEFPKGIRFIANYILVPLMWVYMAILYAYFFKIIIQSELPRGNLGWIITTFGTIGIITKMVVYPVRDTGTNLLRLFDKYYYYALVVPIILLAVAIGVRINDYGMTEHRYGVVLLGIWFIAVTVFTFIKKEQLHIKYVPITFATLAFLASFGPWGAVELSLKSQFDRLESALLKHNLLENGKIVKLKGELTFEERKSLSSLADYFVRKKYRYEKIKPWVGDLLDKDDEPGKKIYRYRSGKDVVALMGFEYVNRWQTTEKDSNAFEYVNHTLININNTFIEVSNYDYVTLFSFYSQREFEKKLNIEHDGKIRSVKLSHLDGGIYVTYNDDEAEFDLKDYVSGLISEKITSITGVTLSKFNLSKQSKKKTFKTRVIFERIRGNGINKNDIEIQNVRCYIMIKFNS